MTGKVNISEKLASFNKHWSPKIIGELNGQYVKVVKFKGEYVWHHHDNEDEMFWVIKGNMEIHLEKSVINLSEGEFYIVSHGVEHKPVAAEECHCVLFEPATTRNTGNVNHEYTIEPNDLEKL
jgi:mannose-6-phosphate isomerase-like protein (cupin superfamily)